MSTSSQQDAYTFEREILDGFQSAINTLPGFACSPLDFDDRPGRVSIDALGEVTFQGASPLLMIEAKMSLFPRDVRNIIWKMEEYRRSNVPDRPALPVTVSATISTGARKELQQAQVGYFDTSGSLFLPIPGAYVLVEKPMTRKQVKVVGSVFEGRRGQVIEALWEAQRDWRGVKAIAERVEMSADLAPAPTTATGRTAS